MKRRGILLEGRAVRLTIPGSEGWSGEGRLLQVHTGMVSVECSHSIPAGTTLRVDADDMLLLGKCRGCESDGSYFRAEISTEQIIPSLSNLARLVAAVCGVSPRPATVGEQEPVRSQQAG